MSDLSEWRRKIQKAATESIPTAVNAGPLRVARLYEMMLESVPDLCDPEIPCEQNGKRYAPLEWQHQVRWALESLKSKGIIRRAPGSGWEVA